MWINYWLVAAKTKFIIVAKTATAFNQSKPVNAILTKSGSYKTPKNNKAPLVRWGVSLVIGTNVLYIESLDKQLLKIFPKIFPNSSPLCDSAPLREIKLRKSSQIGRNKSWKSKQQ
ncbi:hypothetical protein H6G54_14485 [Anabaena cylindrica FACHB-243]|uniref:hypothetical protein n=1 Tax=Anabaena TaxID=1163 RepID=UPI0005AB0120|nr:MULTISPECIES: hypothetical protein [Anabaena]MBD2418885.1 hypothetical protein [Anabaena cylindrica FACHB-243]MBY5284925.1 hypothetical protein [Anabaena sp. CCAP 1446/1C]MBY5310944.1 hypothetical protein [Anabaena sp. CCAP 1446/1C]MCM2405165.1 hypothetical protein [Anabaena sp. CCAP 1446/1C]BAY06063.1 hypothetical protein NIES19_53450 [Anabaena cylindrica PCC 7122]